MRARGCGVGVIAGHLNGWIPPGKAWQSVAEPVLRGAYGGLPIHQAFVQIFVLQAGYRLQTQAAPVLKTFL